MYIQALGNAFLTDAERLSYMCVCIYKFLYIYIYIYIYITRMYIQALGNAFLTDAERLKFESAVASANSRKVEATQRLQKLSDKYAQEMKKLESESGA